MVANYLLGQFLPPYVSFVFNKPRVRSNANVIKQGIRAGHTNARINQTIRAREGAGLRNQDLGRAVNSLKDQMARQQNYRNLPRGRAPRLDTIPVDWGRMDRNFKSVVRLEVFNPTTGETTFEHITVRYDENMIAEEIQEFGMERGRALQAEEAKYQRLQGNIVGGLQLEIYRRQLLN